MTIERSLFGDTIYIIDMSSIKELHDKYPENLFPTIWDRVSTLIQNGQIFSHIEVQREIKNTTNPNDKILLWANRAKKIFLGIDDCQIQTIPLVKGKFNSDHWNNKMNKPAPWADPYLIAMAACEKAIIITQENKTKPTQIPSIANQFEVKSINLLEFFQVLKIKL